jgi:hypothetical protein
MASTWWFSRAIAGAAKAAAGDTTSAGQTTGRQKVNGSARRQPEDLPAAPDATARPTNSLTEKVKGLAVNAEGLLWCRFRPRAGGGREFDRFLGRRGRRRGRPACCRAAFRALGFRWARVEDESKRRRQGLVVCRVT